MKLLFIISFVLVDLCRALEYGTPNNLCLIDKDLTEQCLCETYPASVGRVRIWCEGGKAFSELNSAAKSIKNMVVDELTISSGDVKTIARHDFSNFPDLKKLLLPKNGIKSLRHDAFKDLKYLGTLNLSDNELTEVKKEPLYHLAHLENLSLANNKIESIDPVVFHKMAMLKVLDLSGNQLKTIEISWFSKLAGLQQLSLANNHLQELEIITFRYLISLVKLDLSGNNLTTLNENLFTENTKLDKVNLTGNPWICDDQMLPLSEWLKKHEANKEGARCALPLHLQNSALQKGLEILFLEHSIQDSPTCNATMCNCTVSRDKEVISVDCSNRGMTKLPETVPNKTRVINLRGNNIQSLTTDHLDSAKWSGVSFLHLNNNLIDSLKGLEGTWLVRNLVALHLTNNHLTEIPVHILEQLRGGLLDELYLSGNPWNCDCNTVRFQTWLQDNYKTVKDFDGIRCSPASGAHSNQPIYRLMKSQLCPQDANPVHYLDILNSLMAIAIILIICKLSYDYWLQKRTGKLPRFFSLNLK